ncbi:chemotaxis protein CheD [Duganella sp. P38]|uniref:chemotaxis protein CheD n=1 Tax=Duganella sp. P38 TaxID=3423949 RepID=UPI003D7A7746
MHTLFNFPQPQPWTSPPADGPRAPLQVGMGQLLAGSRDEQLSALLGSCVGIGLIWKERGRCALAHCLLPECPQMAGEFGARYVNQAVPSLLHLLGATEADCAGIEVVIAGGATMLNGCSSRLQIGQQNADAARKYLRKFGLNVTYCRVGGKCGRTLTIDCATGSYAVHEIASTCAGSVHA